MNGRKQWIWLGNWTDSEQVHPGVVHFRRTLRLEATPAEAKVQVSADTRYRLLVNGHPVGFGPLKGDAVRWFSDEIDLAPWLTAGENVLAAIVLRYPPIPHEGAESIWRTFTPGFMMEGFLRFADGTEQPLRTDEDWRAARAPHVGIRPDGGLNFLWIREETRGDADRNGWTRGGYDDSGWETPVVLNPFLLPTCVSPGSASPRPVPQMFETRRRFAGTVCVREGSVSKDTWNALLATDAAVGVPARTEEIVEIDAGELTTGFLELTLSGGAGAHFEILTSECYAYPPEDPESRHPMPKKGDRTDHRGGRLYGMTDTYEPAGDGTSECPETYEPFWFRTFRYLRILVRTGDAPLTLKSFTYRETGYPLEARTEVRTSSKEFSDIWDISLRTLRRCMHETYEDCPFYEQLQYAQDTRSQILFTYAVSADDRLARKCIDDFHSSQYPDGLVSSCYPAYGHNIIPGFSLYYLLMLHDHMMHFGDRAFLRRYLPTMDAVLGFFDANRTSDGLVAKIGGPLGEHRWSFVDWTRQWRETLGVPPASLKGPLTFESLLYAHALDRSAEVAEWLGRTETANEYRDRAAAVRDAVNRFCRGRDGLYQDGPGVDEYGQHCQVMAVLSGAVKGAEARALMDRTLSDASLTQCSVAMAWYLFRAVEATGLYDRTTALWQPWRDMLADNLTTCVEDPVGGRSDCHAWGAIALYELPCVILGVRPAAPGYAAVRISPNAAGLDHAQGTIATPRGTVRVSWVRTETGLDVRHEVPEGMTVLP